MTAIMTLPTYVVPNSEAQVTFELTQPGANYCRVWVMEAPAGSVLDVKLKDSTQSRFLVYQGDGGLDRPWREALDKGGKYTFVAQEYTRGSGYGGGYEGDPDGAPTETKVGGETTLELFIGQKMTQRIGVHPDDATLVVWCWGDYIRATRQTVEGESSPRIEAQSPSPRAKGAIEAADVKTALAALVDQPYTTIGGNLTTIVTNLVGKLNAHNALGSTTHNAADVDNVIPVEVASAPTPRTLAELINHALITMRNHYLNDHGPDVITPSPPGIGTANYHQIGGVGKADFLNLPLYQGVGGLEDSYGAIADLWRAHEGHRVNLVVHGTADAANALPALPPLLEVHRRFLAAIASLSPAVAPAQSNMASTLINSYGFEEAR